VVGDLPRRPTLLHFPPLLATPSALVSYGTAPPPRELRGRRSRPRRNERQTRARRDRRGRQRARRRGPQRSNRPSRRRRRAPGAAARPCTDHPAEPSPPARRMSSRRAGAPDRAVPGGTCSASSFPLETSASSSMEACRSVASSRAGRDDHAGPAREEQCVRVSRAEVDGVAAGKLVPRQRLVVPAGMLLAPDGGDGAARPRRRRKTKPLRCGASTSMAWTVIPRASSSARARRPCSSFPVAVKKSTTRQLRELDRGDGASPAACSHDSDA
jgi:hypothetical protein